jgi:hypothetical protein
MRRSFLLFSLSLFLLLGSPAHAQIKLDDGGKVSVGIASPEAVRQMLVRATYSTESGRAIFAELTGSVQATAIEGRAVNGDLGRGGLFTGGWTGIRADATNPGYGWRYGVRATGSDGEFNYGVRAHSEGGLVAYGIYASAPAVSSSFAGYFSGHVTVTGTFSNPSDQLLKRDIQPLRDEGVVDRLMQLRPTTFLYRTEYEFMGLSRERRFGFIAQEVEAVFPELVSEQVHSPQQDDEGRIVREALSYKGVDQLSLIPILVQAIQEQQMEIEALRAALARHGIPVE